MTEDVKQAGNSCDEVCFVVFSEKDAVCFVWVITVVCSWHIDNQHLL